MFTCEACGKRKPDADRCLGERGGHTYCEDCAWTRCCIACYATKSKSYEWVRIWSPYWGYGLHCGACAKKEAKELRDKAAKLELEADIADVDA